jgi:hypothetical protein
MAIYTLTFHGDSKSGLERVREEEVRLATAANTIAVIAAAEDGAVIVLPAGFVHARTTAQRDRWASQLNELSREHGVALVFGIDVADEDAWEPLARPRSFAYACDRGRKLLWAIEPLSCASFSLGRMILLADTWCLLLVDNEVFQPHARDLVQKARPELVLVLAHGGATPRWLRPLSILDRLAPVLLVHSRLRRRKVVWENGPRGWFSMPVNMDRIVTIHRHAPPSLHGAATLSMGH